jgi:hypothetical protein
LSKVLSRLTARLALKKSGIKTSKLGWFWLFQIILTIIATRFIDKCIGFLIDVANNRWEPGTYLEGVTGLLAIIGATIFAIILILMHTGKIKDGQPKDKEKIDDDDIIEVIKEKIIDIDSKLVLAKEELDIVLDSSKYFKHDSDILKRCINTDTISKIRILIGSSVVDDNKTRENKQQTSNIDTNENSLFQSLLQIIKDLKIEKNKIIEIRMLNFPLFQSMIIIDPLSIEHGQIYFEHIFFPTKEKEYRSILRILKRSKNTDKKNIFDSTYDIFLNQWNNGIRIQ